MHHKESGVLKTLLTQRRICWQPHSCADSCVARLAPLPAMLGTLKPLFIVSRIISFSSISRSIRSVYSTSAFPHHAPRPAPMKCSQGSLISGTFRTCASGD